MISRKKEYNTIKTLVEKETKRLDPDNELKRDSSYITLSWPCGAQLVFTWNRDMSEVVKKVVSEIDWEKE